MAKDLDRLLASGLLEVPQDFVQRVMRRIADVPPPVRAAPPREWLQWLALIGGVILGAIPLGGFMFGVWLTATAG